MTDTITLPRAVLEQALEALGEATHYTSCESWSPSMTDDCLSVVAKLRAALEQPQVEAATGKDYLQVPAGFVLLQTENGKPVYSACLDGGRFHGWLMWKHPDGQWVSKRKLEAWEIMQAEDQRDYGIVQGD